MARGKDGLHGNQRKLCSTFQFVFPSLSRIIPGVWDIWRVSGVCHTKLEFPALSYLNSCTPGSSTEGSAQHRALGMGCSQNPARIPGRIPWNGPVLQQLPGTGGRAEAPPPTIPFVGQQLLHEEQHWNPRC